VAVTEHLEVKQKIRVALVSSNDDWYASSVQDIQGKELFISVPVKKTRSLLLFRGEKVEVTFTAKLARYQFVTSVLGLRRENIPMFVLEMPENFRRIQLRQFVRVPINLPVGYSLIPDEGEEPVFTRVESLDLSGGGIRLLTDEDLAKDTRLIIEFVLPFNKEPEYFRVYGVVVRSWQDEVTDLRQMAVRFTRINNRQVDLISKYLFTVMSELRRLRLD